MKRLLLIAVLVGAALVPLAAQAQRGMGGRGGGMGARGGVAVPRASFAGRPAGGVRPMGAVRPTGLRVSPAGSRFFVPGQRTFIPRNRFAFNRFNRFHHRRFFFGNTCFNSFGTSFGCVNPFLTGGFASPFYDPFLFDSFYPTQPQQPQQPVVVENEGNNRETDFELQALRDEIQAMRDEEQARDQARNNPPARPTAQREDGNAVLVFRDGRQLTVHNYAISDHTIWVLSPNSARKFPLADLDATATEEANARNGVEFHIPK